MFASTDNHETVQGVVSNPFEVKKQPNKCRDPLFAVLFYVNLAVIIGIAAIYGANPFTIEADANNNNNNGDTRK